MPTSLKLFSLSVLVLVLLGAQPAAAQVEFDEDGRPTLEGEQTFPTEHFLIHYTLVGEDAVSPDDENENGTPDYVEQVAAALEEAYTTQVDEWGWAPPPPDAGKGGDDRFDVYLAQLLAAGIAGLVSPANGWIGDNPNTDEIERNAAYTFMVLDNDFAELRDLEPTYDEGTAERYLAAVVAHEFNHMVQSGYNGFDDAVWLYEGSATWTETQSFGSPEFALEYVPYTLKNPDYCLPDNTGREQSGLRWYGSWLFFQHLSDEYGRDIMRDLWAEMSRSTGQEALEATLAAYDTSLAGEALAFAVKNVVRAYQAGEDLPTVRLEGEASIGRFSPDDGVQPLGVDYIRLTAEEEQTVTIALFEQDTDFTLSVITIAEDGEGATFTAGDESVEAVITPERPTYLLVFNAQPWEDPFRCTFADYGVTIQLTEGPGPTEGQTLEDVNYASPIVGDEADDPSGVLQVDRPFITDPERRFGERPESLNAPFDLVIPQPVTGYEFDFATLRDADEFGFLDSYYVPNGGEAAVFDYSNTDDEWLRLTQSVTIYTSLEEWLDDISYDTEGEIITMGGVEVLLENLTREGQPWISVTIITDELFIVVDGSGSEDDVLAMVEETIRAAGSFVMPGGGGQPTPVVQPPFNPQPEYSPLTPELQREVWLSITGVIVGTLFLGLLGVAVIVLTIARLIPPPPGRRP